jgi:hypothetical protein
MLSIAGCTKAGGTTAPEASGKAKPVHREQATSTQEANAEISDAGQIAAATRPAPPQRVFRPAVEMPHYDDGRLADLGIRRYESTHLILYTDIDPKLARPLPGLMDQAYAAWEDYFGSLPPDLDGKVFQMVGFIMADRALFQEADLISPDAQILLEGVFRNQFFWMNDQPIDYYRRHLMIHEGTHCFMTALPNPTNRFQWYMEGMAELFRAHQTDAKGQTRFRLFPQDRETFGGLGWIRLIHEDIRDTGLRLPEAVVGQRPNDFRKYNAYAWSWALCAFLDGHPRYHDRFRHIGSLVTARNDAAFELQKVFEADWPELTEEWLVYTGNLCYGYDIERTTLDLRAGFPLTNVDTRKEFDVAADRGWQSSGILVKPGQVYLVTAGGQTVLAQVPKPWVSEAQGISFRYHAGHPLGMLVAAIGSAELPQQEPPTSTLLTVLPIGREAQIKPRIAGTLYFRVNDYWNELADNTGKLHVTVKPGN